jgi:hypothetical protein
MQTIGKTIQIFLPEGNPRGVKIAEITSRTVQAILFPRSLLSEVSKRPELDNVGIYILIGLSDSEQKVYIGEAENCLNRLKQHNQSKEFWTHAIVFISKTQFFTKTHIKFLEWLSYDQALKANRFLLENTNIPTKPHLSESVESDLYDNFETVQILASTLGYPIFDIIKKPAKKEIIICSGKLAKATGEYTEEGLVVFSNSTCNIDEASGLGSWVINLRKKLVDNKILIKENNVYKFTNDYVFSSPSAAAAVVLARSANGWTEWKYNDGRTLDEVKRKSE